MDVDDGGKGDVKSHEKDESEYEESLFTDGCGEIPVKFAENIAQALGIDYTPSAFQIRWGPCKGKIIPFSDLTH